MPRREQNGYRAVTQATLIERNRPLSTETAGPCAPYKWKSSEPWQERDSDL